MRNADLAKIYSTAGLQEPGRRAAQNAVAEDYSNYSAHLFQSQSLQLQEDPAQFNLRRIRRESELLLANLLAPRAAAICRAGPRSNPASPTCRRDASDSPPSAARLK